MSSPDTEPAVRERPILFSAPMVRAILDGTKTQTRRIVDVDHAATLGLKLDAGGWLRTYVGDATGETDDPEDQWMLVQDGFERGMRCKYGSPGDRLWVRETWAPRSGGLALSKIQRPFYRADEVDERVNPWRWRPSIHMPRWACRLVLEITDVRVERLQEISQDDAVAEGCDDTRDMDPRPGRVFHADGPRGAYRHLWDQINGAGAWDANPWVWAITFRRLP